MSFVLGLSDGSSPQSLSCIAVGSLSIGKVNEVQVSSSEEH